jgi:hypothetical protein
MRRRAGRAAPVRIWDARTRDVVTVGPHTAGTTAATILGSGGFSAISVGGALSEDEQRLWDETVRDHEAEARDALPPVVVGGSWGAVLLVLFGVPMAGLAIGAATGVAWLVWRLRRG